MDLRDNLKIAKKVDILVRKAFGRSFSGRFSEIKTLFDTDYAFIYHDYYELRYLARGYKQEYNRVYARLNPLGRFQALDGSYLKLYSEEERWIEKAKRFAELYRDKFGKEPTIEISPHEPQIKIKRRKLKVIESSIPQIVSLKSLN